MHLLHSEKHPTKYFDRLEKKRKQAERTFTEQEKGFGEGFLRQPKTALRAFLRQQGGDNEVIKAVQILEEDGVWWADVKFTGFQTASALAIETLHMFQSVGAGHWDMELPGGQKVLLTSGGRLKGGEIFWHGTSWDAFVRVTRERKLKAGPSLPTAVYALDSLFNVIDHGYFAGAVFYFEAVALDASKASAKKLPAPQPGVCTFNPERSAPEWRFHEDSFNLLGVRLHLDEVRARMKEAFGPPPAKARPSLAFHFPTASASSSSSAAAPPPPPAE